MTPLAEDNNPAPRNPSGLALNISAVERETGLSKDVLRLKGETI